MRKPRSDATLKTLPPEMQEELFDFLQHHSCPAGVVWLAARGIRTQRCSVRKFWHWYALERQMEEASDVGEVLQDYLAQEPALPFTTGQLAGITQLIFETQVLQRGDIGRFVALRRLRQHDEQVEYRKQRLVQREEALRQARVRSQRQLCRQFYRWAEDEKVRQALKSDARFDEKIEALGHAMFGDDWDDLPSEEESPPLPELPDSAPPPPMD